MSSSAVRLLATLALGGQVLPVGSPLVCNHVARGARTGCEQQMASSPGGRTLAPASHSLACVNAALCPTQGTAVPALTLAVCVSFGASHAIGFAVSSIAPADPQPPLSPPPQA